MFFIALLCIFALFTVLIIRYSILPLALPTVVKVFLSLVLIVSASGYPILRLTGIQVEGLTRTFIYWSAYLYLGYITFWALFFLITKLGQRLLSRKKQKVQGAENAISRRDFLSQAGVVSLGLVPMVPVAMGMNNALVCKPKIIKQNITVPHRAARLSGLRIVLLSDLHIGDVLDGRWLTGVVEQVNALHADIIFITGDIVDGSVERLREDIAPLQNLQAIHGVFAVAGNHEFYSGVDAWVAHLRSLGITVLTNEHRTLEINGTKLVIAGMWDRKGYRFGEQYRENAAEALHGASDFDYSIMLAHQPKSVELSVEQGIDLQVSGHTHSGQYWPYTEVVKLFQEYPKGLYQVHDTQLYVNIGTGFWGPPLRLATYNEISVLDFVADSSHKS